MKRNFFALFLVFMMVTALVGCGTDKDTDPDSMAEQEQQTTEQKEEATKDEDLQTTEDISEEPEDQTTEGNTDSDVNPVKPKDPIHLILYKSNENADGFIETSVEIEELNEHGIVEHLILADILAAGTKLNEIEKKTENNSLLLILDFNEKFTERLFSYGTTGEYLMMGSVVNTFLKAYEADSVMIRVNGGIVESGHMIYDEPMSFFK